MKWDTRHGDNIKELSMKPLILFSFLFLTCAFAEDQATKNTEYKNDASISFIIPSSSLTDEWREAAIRNAKYNLRTVLDNEGCTEPEHLVGLSQRRGFFSYSATVKGSAKCLHKLLIIGSITSFDNSWSDDESDFHITVQNQTTSKSSLYFFKGDDLITIK